jgi:hypothetical protein
MSENKDMVEKIELNDLLIEMVNEVLEEEGKGLRLRVEEVDASIFVPTVTAADEVIKSPAYKEDVKENTSLLVDMKVREVAKGLLNGVLIKLHINERREVWIKNHGVHEAEILESDLNSSSSEIEKGIGIGKETEKMLEEKSHQISGAVKAAIERMMRRVVALRKENVGMIAGEIWNLLNIRGELSISEVISEISIQPSIVYSGLGWLAGEDKLEFVKKEGKHLVHLT